MDENENLNPPNSPEGPGPEKPEEDPSSNPPSGPSGEEKTSSFPVSGSPNSSSPKPTPPPADKPAPKPAPPKSSDPVGKSAMETVTGNEEGMPRRTFIKFLTIGWMAFAAALGGAGTMVLRFLFPNVLFEPKQTFKAGTPDEYAVGEVSLRWKGKHGVWLVRDEEKLYALSTVCTHLGCTPNWLGNEGKFKCPCHGSGFYITGINFEGPAPRPLERYKIALDDDGQILVDKTQKFQQEKGEWSDPESFLLA